MIRTNRLEEFVEHLINKKNEETNEKAMWEFWLHKVYEGSFEDFMKKNNYKGSNAENETATKEEQVAIINRSFEMMNGFKPS